MASSDSQPSERTRLADVLDETDVRAGGSFADLPVLSLTKDRGVIRQSVRFKHRVATEDVASYKVLKRT